MRSCVCFYLVISSFGLIGTTPVNATMQIGGVTTTRTVPNANSFNTLTVNGTDVLKTEMFDAMVNSLNMRVFADDAHVEQYMSLLTEIIDVMADMNSGVIDFAMGPVAVGDAPNASMGWIYPAGFVKKTPKGRPQEFKQKVATPAVASATAIAAIRSGTTRADCGACIDATILIAHLKYFGDEWINGQIAAGAVVIDLDRTFVAGTISATMVPGGYAYIKNKSDYAAKGAANGKSVLNWNGEHLIYVGGNMYSGLGVDPCTLNEVRDILAEGYKTDTGVQMSNSAKESLHLEHHERIAVPQKV